MFRKTPSLPTSFEAVYDAHVDAIYRYTFHCVGNRYEAEDLTAQTFYKALKNFWRFRWTGVPISSWLFRIATNEVHSYYRQTEKTKAHSEEESENLPSLDDSVEKKRQRNAVFLSLSRCMEHLKPQDRSLLVLRFLEKKTYAELEQVTGKRVSSLKMRVHRALKQLQVEMEKQGVDHAFFRAAFAKPC